MARKKGTGDGDGDHGTEEAKADPPPSRAPGAGWGSQRRKKIPNHLRFHA